MKTKSVVYSVLVTLPLPVRFLKMLNLVAGSHKKRGRICWDCGLGVENWGFVCAVNAKWRFEGY